MFGFVRVVSFSWLLGVVVALLGRNWFLEGLLLGLWSRFPLVVSVGGLVLVAVGSLLLRCLEVVSWRLLGVRRWVRCVLIVACVSQCPV